MIPMLTNHIMGGLQKGEVKFKKFKTHVYLYKALFDMLSLDLSTTVDYCL